MSHLSSREVSHTPGPWQTRMGRDLDTPVAHVFAPSRGAAIATVEAWSQQDDANARLIAAAPTLLQALSDLVDCDSEGHADELMEGDHIAANCAFCAAVAALKEARHALS